MLTRTMIAAVSVLAASTFLAVPAQAEPGDNPCNLAVNFLCRFVPTAPDLDHDIDLTELQPPADPNAPPPESLPPVNPCAAGCI
jgi:hypothetical protein